MGSSCAAMRAVSVSYTHLAGVGSNRSRQTHRQRRVDDRDSRRQGIVSQRVFLVFLFIGDDGERRYF